VVQEPSVAPETNITVFCEKEITASQPVICKWADYTASIGRVNWERYGSGRNIF
jgi:hypothetical protein